MYIMLKSIWYIIQYVIMLYGMILWQLYDMKWYDITWYDRISQCMNYITFWYIIAKSLECHFHRTTSAQRTPYSPLSPRKGWPAIRRVRAICRLGWECWTIFFGTTILALLKKSWSGWNRHVFFSSSPLIEEICVAQDRGWFSPFQWNFSLER